MIYPSIDLMNGKAVQLVQGKKENKKLEIDDVFGLADKFSQLGHINVIDLDAAFGNGDNRQLIQRLAAKYPIRVGGGIRSVDIAKAYIEAGTEKIIIGSAAFQKNRVNSEFLSALRDRIKREQIIIALDSYQKAVVTKGWTETTTLDAAEIIKSLEEYCGEYLYTQVDKEGMMQGTNVERIVALKALTSNQLTAAGGISTVEEIQELWSHGIYSVLGMALYTEKLPFETLMKIKHSK